MGENCELRFRPGSFVFHTRCGICMINEVSPLVGDRSGTMYYVLQPLYGENKNNIVRVPVSNAISLKEPFNKAEIDLMIANWPSKDSDLYILDSKERKNAYEAALAQGDINRLAPLLEGAYQRKRRDGHLNSMDQQFVNRAEPILFGSISHAAGLDYHAVPDYINENVH